MDQSLETNTNLLDAKPANRYRWPLLLALLWLVAALCGLFVLSRYANTPGDSGQTPRHWPRDTAIELNPSGDTLVMFVHPHCPCSSASLSELQRMMAHCAGGVKAWVAFYKPSTMPAGWEQSDTWHTALNMPSVHVISDPEGAEARRFHAATSGQTVLYDAKGNLLFSGGITAARGHEGDNAGETAMEDLVNSANSECRQTPVFGCPIVPSPPPITGR